MASAVVTLLLAATCLAAICLAWTCLASICAAQEILELLQPLRHGPLTVWIIGPAQPRIKLPSNYAITSPTSMDYKEQTTGSFGQSASNYGQDAGSYGAPSDTTAISTRQAAPGQDAPAPGPDGSGYHEQTSGSFGQAASNTGTNASDHGQTAGSFGQNASNVGTNASNHGQTAGSFGQAAGSFGVGATPSGQPANNPGNPAASAPSMVQMYLAAALRKAFPALQVRYVDVASDELKDRLSAATGSSIYPDVLVGALPDSWSSDLRSRFVLLTIQPASVYNDGLSDGRPRDAAISITNRAPHREAARAMALWAGELGSGCDGCLQVDAARTPYGSIALTAVGQLLRGLPVGNLADPEMAAFPPLLGRSMLLTSANTSADDSAAHLQIVKATCNGSLAVVSLRVVAASDKVFGLAHPLVVLRKMSDGQWKVLHVSLNLPAADQEMARVSLMATRPVSAAEARAGVLGVKLATPIEGDTRPPMPELSWDNGGGAGLQVVEWQTAVNGGWSDPRLFLVNDHGTRLKTQVTAAFAIHQTRYRWRVWSVGAGGEMTISPWRTLNIAE
jgi:hypothetical protein